MSHSLRTRSALVHHRGVLLQQSLYRPPANSCRKSVSVGRKKVLQRAGVQAFGRFSAPTLQAPGLIGKKGGKKDEQSPFVLSEPYRGQPFPWLACIITNLRSSLPATSSTVRNPSHIRPSSSSNSQVLHAAGPLSSWLVEVQLAAIS